MMRVLTLMFIPKADISCCSVGVTLFKIMKQTGFILQFFYHSEAIVGMHFPNRYTEYFK